LEQGFIDLPYPEPLLGTNEPFPFAFVGDEAFPLKTYLMRPYAKPKKRYQQARIAQRQANDNCNDEDVHENTQDNERIDEYLDHTLPGLTIPQFSIIGCLELEEQLRMPSAFLFQNGLF